MEKRHLFLSYCSENRQEVAKLRNDLIAHGEYVWWDQDILPGQDWNAAIRQAMNDAYAIIACFSRETDARIKSGMYPELRSAVDAYRRYAPGSIFLIPVRVSLSRIPELELDESRTLDRLQYVDLFPETQRDDGLEKLIEAVRAAPLHP